MDTNLNEFISYDMSEFRSIVTRVIDEVHGVVVGKDSLIFDLMIALLSEGNVLIEGVPGVAKTTIAKIFSSSIGLDFKRVQFVPDIMPSDITGASIMNQKTMEYEIYKGPIFTNILLIDEINRASPKVQSSLLEAMEEKQVTIDGIGFQLPDPFMLIATKNPIDVVGTFPLPEAQIDRFMLKLNVGYPTEDEEKELLRHKNAPVASTTEKKTDRADVLRMIDAVKRIYVQEKIYSYICDLVLMSRRHDKLLLGASPRASISLLKASKAVAAMSGREYVIPDDVKYLIPKVLNHRLIVKPEHEEEGVTPGQVVEELLSRVKVPS
jgi:MoxR-like ATPase